MENDTPVLGNIELKGYALIFAITSAERATCGKAFVANTLGNLAGTPLTTIETVEQAMAAHRKSSLKQQHHSSTLCLIVNLAPRSTDPSTCLATSRRAQPL